MSFSQLVTALALLGAARARDESCIFPGTCTPPEAEFSAVQAVTPRHQWSDNGGYCGAMSIQEIVLSYGAWVSQDIVRKSTSDGGGHGDPTNGWEILHTNIEEALDTLGFEYEAFDYENLPQPQSNAYLAWLKQQLAAGNPVVWFIFCAGDGHNSYNVGAYDHIEGVFGLFSNHSLDDPTVYPDDVLVHTSDYGPDGDANNGYYRRFDSLVDDTSMSGNCSQAIPVWGKNEMYPCVPQDIDYGYAITGQALPSSVVHQPLSLAVDRIDEPDIIEGEAPVDLVGTVTVSDLVPGQEYTLFRFDNYSTVPAQPEQYAAAASFTYSLSSPGADTVVFVDPAGILSSGSTYYRCVASA